MNIYIFEYVECLTSSYHNGGGLVVVAKDIDQLLEVISVDESIKLDDEEIGNVKKYKLSDLEKLDPHYYVFPDAGCC